MGLRFQVFLIARMSPRKGRAGHYRCAGAFYHQHCHDTLSLRALHRFFQLLGVDENAALVREELRNFDDHLGFDDQHLNLAIPCPYTVSLLSIAWTTDLEYQAYLSNYSFQNGLVDATKGCWDISRANPHNAGICVIDITDVATPEYCFVNKPGSTTLSAYQYLRLYMPHTFIARPLQHLDSSATITMSTAADDEGVMRNFIHVLETFWALVDLAGYPLIAASTLCAIWPGAATNRNGPAQVKVPATPDLPNRMPLDVVISLYLGFADLDDLATFEQAFVVNQPHLAVGKAILPPYDGGTEDLYRRTSVILSILAEQRPFESVVDPPYPRDGYNFPAYAIAGDVERLQHSMLERDRIVNRAPDRSSMGSSNDKERCMAAGDEGSLHEWRLWTILGPDKVFSITFRGRKIPNSQLGDLIEALQDLRASTFLDLSGIQLSLRQLMTVLRQFPEVEALSISGNKLIQPGHLPALIASTPTLRRLHAMHFGFESFDVLHTLLHEHSAAFRQLEGLMCPPLLTPNQEITWPASFIFHHATQATSDRPLYVSVPLCTPAQVVQALTEILPLAFQEYHYGESAALWYRNLEFVTHARPGPNSYAMPANGFPFYMSAGTCLHTVLSSAALRPGQCWCERPVVGVPSHGQAYTLRGEGGRTWMFWFDWDHRRHQRANPGKNMWGFVRCEATVHGDVDDPDGITTGIPLHSTYSQTVHDLRGYLRCMADEGRPLPDADAVERLERILDMRDPDTMQPVCALMTQDDLEPIVGRPSTEEDRKFYYKEVYRGLTGENLRTGVMFPGYWPGKQSRRSKSLFL